MIGASSKVFVLFSSLMLATFDLFSSLQSAGLIGVTFGFLGGIGGIFVFC
jgi:hypothetical protein